MNHTQLLNYLIEKHNLKSYCEIGVRATAQNFDKIKCGFKMGVDPAVHNNPDIAPVASDEFFKGALTDKSLRFGLIFLDGLHHSDQLERDFNNSLKCLSDGGYIVIHDCLPKDEITTCVPRGSQKIWHGDVYKFCMKLNTIPDIGFVTLDMDEGCCVVWKEPGKKPVDYEREPINWNTYQAVGRVLLNVIEPKLFFG